ncbi:hypothetical protein [Streptomyces sp. NPDC023838]|uniref:hypothetical protein n=1 Tax=Streptomyces sp. NPDC023838 TaxID=3154325 RepID=UPI0033FB2BE3
MSDPQHVPQLPQEETALIRAWHGRGYALARQEAANGERLVHCLGLDLVVPPHVLIPAPMDRSGLRWWTGWSGSGTADRWSTSPTS